MDQATDLDELWPIVAAEAARLLGASAKMMQWTGQRWVIRGSSTDNDRHDVTLSDPEPSGAGGGASAEATLPLLTGVGGHARSVLVTTLDGTALRVPTRLVWTSPVADAFLATADLAAEYARFASGAVQRTHDRMHLQRAVTARHRIGQAQGILMARHQLSADEAFDLLIRRSQNTNVKLSVLADHVVATGDLDSGGTAPHRRGGSKEAERRDGALTSTQPSPPGSDIPGADSPAPDDHATDSVVVTPELGDALSTAIIVGTGDSSERAEVMCALVEEMRGSVEWLNDTGSPEELRSLEPTVVAVRQHLYRMLHLAGSTERTDLAERAS